MTYDVQFSDGSMGYGLTQSELDYWESVGYTYTVIAEYNGNGTIYGNITNVEMQIGSEIGSEYYDSASGQLPASIPVDDQTFEIHIKFKSTYTSAISTLCTIYLKNPNGITYTIPYWHRVGISPGEELIWNFSPPGAVNSIPGMWTLAIEFEVDGAVVAAWGWDNLFDASGGELKAYLEKWVNKSPEGNNLQMPAAVSATSDTFEIGIKYKNTSSVGYNARPIVTATGPGTNQNIIGTPVRNYSWINPGEEVSYTFDIFTVDAAGQWTCSIKIVTDGGVVAAEYIGPCLIVRGDVAGDSGVITDMYFNYDDNIRVPFGTAIPADGHTLEIGIRYQNTSPGNVIMGVQCEVWDPDGLKQTTTPIDWADLGTGLPTPYLKTYNFGKVTKVGNWKAKIKLLKQNMTIMDEWPASGNNGLLLVSYNPSTQPPPTENPEDKKSTFPWIPVMLGSAAVIAFAIMSNPNTSQKAVSYSKQAYAAGKKLLKG
jgi:hypothetical protein